MPSTQPDGTRIVYAGDTGPNPELARQRRRTPTCSCARRPSASTDEDDDGARGHLTLDEALEHGRAARATRLLITHYPSARRDAMTARLAGLDGTVVLARPGLELEVQGGDRYADVQAAGAPAASSDPIPFDRPRRGSAGEAGGR